MKRGTSEDSESPERKRVTRRSKRRVTAAAAAAEAAAAGTAAAAVAAAAEAEAGAANPAATIAEAIRIELLESAIRCAINAGPREFFKAKPMILVSLREAHSLFEYSACDAFRAQLAISGDCYHVKFDPVNLIDVPMKSIVSTIRTFGDQISFVHISDYNNIIASRIIDIKMAQYLGSLLDHLHTNAMKDLKQSTLMIKFNRYYQMTNGLMFLMTIKQLPSIG